MSNTPLIALSTPSHGSNTDTWDADPVNNNSNILDSCFGGVLSLSAASTTLGNTNAQNAVLKWTGTISSNVTTTITGIIKTWTVLNNTSGSFNIVLSTGTGNAIGVPPGEPHDVFSDGTSFYFKGLGPVGSYVDIAASSVPGWISACTVPPLLKCDGSTFSPTTYPALSSLLGTSTLPNLSGRVRAYLNDGTGRITTAGAGVDGDTRFSAGGTQTSIVTATNLPPLGVSITDPGHSHSIHLTTFAAGGNATGADTGPGSGTTGSQTTGITATANSTGTSAAFSNLPPIQIGGISMIRAA